MKVSGHVTASDDVKLWNYLLITYLCIGYMLNVGGNDRQPNQTRVTSYIQTDLAGLLPKALVDQALPSNQINFFTSLKAALADRVKSNDLINWASAGARRTQCSDVNQRVKRILPLATSTTCHCRRLNSFRYIAYRSLVHCWTVHANISYRFNSSLAYAGLLCYVLWYCTAVVLVWINRLWL